MDHTQDCQNLNCCDFETAFEAVGEAFANLCRCLKPACKWALTSGPLHKDLGMLSLLARVNNTNNFAVKVKLIIEELDGPPSVFHCEEKTITACHSGAFSIVDFTQFTKVAFSVSWEFRNAQTDEPVCSKVYVFAAGRFDLPNVTEINSHFIASSTLFHADFVVRENDTQCLPVCP